MFINNIIDSDYIEGYIGKSWKEQKKELLKYYSKKYSNKKIKITRVKSDTRGLRCYIVEEIREKKEV